MWEPIDTAPKDGTEIVAWSECDGMVVTMWTDDVYALNGGSCGPRGWFSYRYDDRWGDRPRFDHPTHWMPNAKPPNAQPTENTR